MQQTDMLWPGCRVGVAVSGGMDSWVLLQVLMLRQRIVPYPFELMVLHVNPGFDPDNHAPLEAWVQKQGLAAHIERTLHGVEAHGPQNRKNSPCFYCAMQRRKRLFHLCREYGLTHLAFGHVAEDLVQTFFLNLLQTARVDGMAAREWFFNRDLLVIRPMLLVEKRYVRSAVRAWDLPIWSNPCPSAGSSRRTAMDQALDRLTQGDRVQRKNVLNALRRRQLDLSRKVS